MQSCFATWAGLEERENLFKIWKFKFMNFLSYRYGLKYSLCTLVRIYKVIYHHYITTKELNITWLDIPIKLIYKTYFLETRIIFVSFPQ